MADEVSRIMGEVAEASKGLDEVFEKALGTSRYSLDNITGADLDSAGRNSPVTGAGMSRMPVTDPRMQVGSIRATGSDIAAGNRKPGEVTSETDTMQQRVHNAPGTTRQYGDSIKSAYGRNSMQSVYPYYNMNFAAEQPYERLNGLSREQTLRNVRMADALNNMQFTAGSDIGARTSLGATGTGVTESGSFQYKPISTEEMRQNDADRGIDTAMRQQQASLAIDTQRHTLENQQQADRLQFNMAEAVGRSDINYAEAWVDAIRSAEYISPNERSASTYTQVYLEYLSKRIKEQNVYDALQVARDPELGALISQVYGNAFGLVMPTQDDYNTNMLVDAVMRKYGWGTNKATQALETYRNALAMSHYGNLWMMMSAAATNGWSIFANNPYKGMLNSDKG